MSTINDPKSDLEARLTTYNADLPDDEKIDLAAVQKALRGLGAATPAQYRRLTAEHLTRAGVPLLLAEEAAAAWAPPAQPTPTPAPATLPTGKFTLETARDVAAGKSTAALLGEYDPANPGVVGEVLAERCAPLAARGGGAKWLLYREDGKPYATESAARLDAMLAGEEVDDLPMIGGVVVEPRRLGEPAKPRRRRVNPLYKGKFLTADKTCTVTSESYADISDEAQGLLYLATRETGEVSANVDPEIARSILGRARGANGAASLRATYRRAAVAFDKKAPTLDVDAEEADRGGPFSGGGEPEQTPPAWTILPTTTEGQWTHERQCALVRALPDAFPSKAELAKMVRFGLGQNLADIADGGTLSDIAFDLVFGWAKARGSLAALFNAAISANPNNRALRLLGAEMTPTSPASPKRARLLTQDEIARVHADAIKVGLAQSRGALLAGMDPSFIVSIPSGAPPGPQTLTDLNETNTVLADGSIPVLRWLSNAVRLTGSRRECATFRDLLAAAGGA